jgi:NTE family protein
MGYNKVGLVLGGGGAKGAYQVGVYKALHENHLTEDIQLFCGTSIGAINSVLFTLDDVSKMEKIWLSLNKDVILSKKKLSQYLDMVKLKNISVYSRSGFLSLLEDNINLEDVSNSPIELYAVATPIRNEFAQTVFQLNGKSPEMIKDILLASSAIPGVFEMVKINGVYYMDGYRISNVPTKIAVTKGCDLVYVVPLGKRDNLTEDSYPDATIIDFKHPSFDDLGFYNGTLGFDPQLIEERINLGYECAAALIKYLRKIGVITATKKDKLYAFIKKLVFKKKHLRNKKNYYSLEDIGIHRVSTNKHKDEISEEDFYAKDH